VGGRVVATARGGVHPTGEGCDVFHLPTDLEELREHGADVPRGEEPSPFGLGHHAGLLGLGIEHRHGVVEWVGGKRRAYPAGAVVLVGMVWH
jgi:hypothetical protein